MKGTNGTKEWIGTSERATSYWIDANNGRKVQLDILIEDNPVGHTQAALVPFRDGAVVEGIRLSKNQSFNNFIEETKKLERRLVNGEMGSVSAPYPEGIKTFTVKSDRPEGSSSVPGSVNLEDEIDNFDAIEDGERGTFGVAMRGGEKEVDDCTPMQEGTRAILLIADLRKPDGTDSISNAYMSAMAVADKDGCESIAVTQIGEKIKDSITGIIDAIGEANLMNMERVILTIKKGDAKGENCDMNELSGYVDGYLALRGKFRE